jgi:hypothetical protein
MENEAVHYVQPDITRLGGVTEFIWVADAAFAKRLPVAAHAGEMGQVHVHLSYWHPACTLWNTFPGLRIVLKNRFLWWTDTLSYRNFPGASTTPAKWNNGKIFSICLTPDACRYYAVSTHFCLTAMRVRFIWSGGCWIGAFDVL